jgi:hypothetical protein
MGTTVPGLGAEVDRPYLAAFSAMLGALETENQRRAAAEKIKAYCGRYANTISTLSPREADWLDGELKSSRVAAAISSVEFSKRYSGEISRYCVTATESLSKPQALSHEMYLWIYVASLLADLDFNWHLQNLARNGAVSLSTQDVEDSASSPTLSRYILKFIALPNMPR